MTTTMEKRMEKVFGKISLIIMDLITYAMMHDTVDTTKWIRRIQKAHEAHVRSELSLQAKEFEELVEGMRVPKDDISACSEPYKTIYTAHNEALDMFLTKLKGRKI